MEQKVCILGTGNVAAHLEHWLAEAGINACICSARRPEHWPEADIYMLAVTDGAISEVARQLRGRNAIAVHLSGSSPIDALNDCRLRGVIYPVQTFTKGIPLNYSEIPLLVEGSTPEVTETLWELAGKMSSKRIAADSEQRRKVHLAGVMASNFPNHLLLLAQMQLETEGFPLDLLRPLMEETLNKAFEKGPYEAQTGPARRNDQMTLNKHMNMLDAETRTKEIYRQISSSINDTYHQ